MTTKRLPSWLTSARTRAVTALLSAVCLFLGAPGDAAAGDSDIDFGIAGVDVAVSGGDMNLLIHFTDDLPYEDQEWLVPIRILFNGALYEGDHRVTDEVTTGPEICTAPVDGACEPHSTPCATTTYTYKDVNDTLSLPWSCVFDPGLPGPLTMIATARSSGSDR